MNVTNFQKNRHGVTKTFDVNRNKFHLKVLFSRLLLLGGNTAKGVGWRGNKNLQHNWKLEEIEKLGFHQISFFSPETD